MGVLRAGDETSEREWKTIRETSFAVVWDTVNEAYFDSTFGGVDWKGVGGTYRGRLSTVGSKNELRGLLREMLGELKRSHFGIVPREAAVFLPAERTRVGVIGATVAWLDRELVFFDVEPGLAAWRAGARPGDAIVSVDGVAIDDLARTLQGATSDEPKAREYIAQVVCARTRGAVGERILFLGRRGTEDARILLIEIAPHEGAWSEPIGSYPSLPIICKTERAIEGIAYLRFNVFAPPIMKEVRMFLKSLKLGDGLIIDLRGNPGGVGAMAAGISGWLMDREVSLGSMKLRQGTMNLPVYPQDGAFLGPLAMLVDQQSASTSEMMAAGLQELGRARLFGARSAGAALPSGFKVLPSGDLFQFAVADVQTPKGRLLEGNGVTPDVAVNVTKGDLVAGRDPVREAAHAWLLREGRRAAEGAFQTTGGR